MRALFQVFLAGCLTVAVGVSRSHAQDACEAGALDLAQVLTCKRAMEINRDQRCAGSAQAQIAPPTGGDRTLNFGDKTQYGSTSKGVVFEAKGQTVVAPAAGRVLFAGSFRSYGKMVIIDGCNIDVIVAGVDTVSTSAGALVARGQLIGAVPDASHVVYLEVRKAGMPVDPFGPLAD